MKNTYKIKIERTNHKSEKSTETVTRCLREPGDLNTYRLGGFQQDSIKVISVENQGASDGFDIDIDIKRNELCFSFDVDLHIENTLERQTNLEKTLIAATEKNNTDIETELENMGYVEVVADNTYNYESDLDDTLNYKVYMPKSKKDGCWLYDASAIVLIEKHIGLDVRAGYTLEGVFKGGYDGIAHFLNVTADLWVCDESGEEIDQYGSVYNLLENYEVQEGSTKQDIKLKEKTTGEICELRWSHPAVY